MKSKVIGFMHVMFLLQLENISPKDENLTDNVQSNLSDSDHAGIVQVLLLRLSEEESLEMMQAK